MKEKSKTNVSVTKKKGTKRKASSDVDKIVHTRNEEKLVKQKEDGKFALKHQRKRKDRKLVEERPQVGFNDDDGASRVKKAKHKKAKKKVRKEKSSLNESAQSYENEQDKDGEQVYIISSGDEDPTKGMRKWITEYHQSRPGLNILQQRIDEFITEHETKLKQERKEKEALAAEGGWTVVAHHKGRKKTTDTESGIAVGSVSQAAVENNLAKKKKKEIGLDFYRFQKREAKRNEILALQSKFEEDKKRIQQLRAARKFKPY